MNRERGTEDGEAVRCSAWLGRTARLHVALNCAIAVWVVNGLLWLAVLIKRIIELTK